MKCQEPDDTILERKENSSLINSEKFRSWYLGESLFPFSMSWFQHVIQRSLLACLKAKSESQESLLMYKVHAVIFKTASLR